MSKNKNKLGVVYSTNPDYQYEYDEPQVADTLPAGQQKLRVRMERSGRGGKTVTIVDKFVGSDDNLEALAKALKTRCGVGGSAKDGLIIIQGDFRDRIIALLQSMGYSQTK